MCVFVVCVCMCVCVRVRVCTCSCAYMLQSSGVVSQEPFTFSKWFADWLGCLPNPRDACLHLLSTEIASTALFGVFTWVLGIELRSSSLHGKPFTD